jgi:D-aspartate ligase
MDRAGGARGPDALVLGGDYTGLGVARSLGTCGVRVVIAAPPGDFACRSRFVRRAINPPETGEPASVLAAARAAGLEHAVVIPCTDLWCEAVSSSSSEEFGLVDAMPAPDTTAVLLDKDRLAETLRRLAIPYPETFRVDRQEDLAVMDGDERTWMLKPRSSQRFLRIFGRKAFVVGDRAAAEQRLDACLRSGLSMTLQEYVPGPPTAHVFVDGFIDRDGVVRARFARRRLRMYPRDLGNSSSGVSISLDEIPDAVHHLEELLADLRYRGIFSAEFKQDAGNGSHKLLEVNCRPYWYVDFPRRCGVNLCLMAYHDALGEPVPTVDRYRTGELFGFPAVELRALVDEWRRGGRSSVALGAGLAGLLRLPLQVDDPLPALTRLAREVRTVASRSAAATAA